MEAGGRGEEQGASRQSGGAGGWGRNLASSGVGVLSGNRDQGAQGALSASNTSEVKSEAAAKEPGLRAGLAAPASVPVQTRSHGTGASRPRRGLEAVSPHKRELASSLPPQGWDLSSPESPAWEP